MPYTTDDVYNKVMLLISGLMPLAGGAVVANAVNTASIFKTNLSASAHPENTICVMTSGALIGQAIYVDWFNGSNKLMGSNYGSAFSAVPSGGDTFVLVTVAGMRFGMPMDLVNAPNQTAIAAIQSGVMMDNPLPLVDNNGGVYISADPQDLSGSLDVNAKLIGGNTPENTSVQQIWDALLVNLSTPNSIGDLMANITTLMDAALSLAHGVGQWGNGLGTGSVLYVPNRATDPLHNPLDGVNTWVTTDLANPTLGLQARGYTDSFGLITPGFLLDPGTYAIWRQRGNDTFSPNPEIITVP